MLRPSAPTAVAKAVPAANSSRVGVTSTLPEIWEVKTEPAHVTRGGMRKVYEYEGGWYEDWWYEEGWYAEGLRV